MIFIIFHSDIKFFQVLSICVYWVAPDHHPGWPRLRGKQWIKRYPWSQRCKHFPVLVLRMRKTCISATLSLQLWHQNSRKASRPVQQIFWRTQSSPLPSPAACRSAGRSGMSRQEPYTKKYNPLWISLTCVTASIHNLCNWSTCNVHVWVTLWLWMAESCWI